jgi:hypothetical protein
VDVFDIKIRSEDNILSEEGSKFLVKEIKQGTLNENK